MFNKFYIYLNKKLRLSFKDENLEKKFKKEYVKDNLKQNKFAIWITLISYTIYLPIGYFITTDDFVYDLILMLALPITSSILMLSYINKIRNKHSLILFFYSIAITIPPIISICYTDKYYKIYLNNYILVMIGIMVIYGAFFLVTFGSALFVNIFAIIVLIVHSKNQPELIYDLFFINTAFIITSIASYLIEKSKRKIYSDKYKMEEQDKFMLQQSKLAQMGEMISMIAHQWRQPLASINSNILGINTKIESNKFDLYNKKSQAEFLNYLNKKHEKIKDYTKELSDIIDVFRTFYKPDKVKKKRSLTLPIENTLKIAQASLEAHNIEIIKNYKTSDDLFIYQNELVQVFSNIFKNSKDNFIEKKIKNKVVNIETEKNNSKFIIRISDNGGGIPENIMNKIFNPYFTTKDEKNGTGMGLYMSKIIVEKHHLGELKVKNIENGVCFEIILPNGENNDKFNETPPVENL